MKILFWAIASVGAAIVLLKAGVALLHAPPGQD